MTKEIFNEGRVVGLSSYEEYVRQIQAEDPNFEVATEREWLSSSLASGSSMILKIRVSDFASISGSPLNITYMFPAGCHICAANPIEAMYFDGECKLIDGTPWAEYVTSYGASIANTSSTNSPADNSTADDLSAVTSNIPVGDMSPLKIDKSKNKVEYTQAQKSMMQYTKILDGIVIQPGTWTESGKGSPFKKFEPDLKKRPAIRIIFSEKPKHDFYILLTGFTNRSVIKGITKSDLGSVGTDNPVDGDFLGPECYPWVAKVSFLSSSAIDNLMRNCLVPGSRNLKIEASEDTPEIKITSNNLLSTSVKEKTSTFAYSPATGTTPPKITKNDRTADYWKNDAGTDIQTSTGTDPRTESNVNGWSVSGEETQVTNDTTHGFVVTNNYQSADDTLGNGRHGGWYDISIDPYKMISGFIDEMYKRWDYQDKMNQYILDQLAMIWGYLTDPASDGLAKAFQELLGITYGSMELNRKKLDLSKIKKADLSNIQVVDGIKGKPSGLKIPMGNINVYSGADSLTSPAIRCHESASADNDLKGV